MYFVCSLRRAPPFVIVRVGPIFGFCISPPPSTIRYAYMRFMCRMGALFTPLLPLTGIVLHSVLRASFCEAVCFLFTMLHATLTACVFSPALG